MGYSILSLPGRKGNYLPPSVQMVESYYICTRLMGFLSTKDVLEGEPKICIVGLSEDVSILLAHYITSVQVSKRLLHLPAWYLPKQGAHPGTEGHPWRRKDLARSVQVLKSRSLFQQLFITAYLFLVNDFLQKVISKSQKMS